MKCIFEDLARRVEARYPTWGRFAVVSAKVFCGLFWFSVALITGLSAYVYAALPLYLYLTHRMVSGEIVNTFYIATLNYFKSHMQAKLHTLIIRALMDAVVIGVVAVTMYTYRRRILKNKSS